MCWVSSNIITKQWGIILEHSIWSLSPIIDATLLDSDCSTDAGIIPKEYTGSNIQSLIHYLIIFFLCFIIDTSSLTNHYGLCTIGTCNICSETIDWNTSTMNCSDVLYVQRIYYHVSHIRRQWDSITVIRWWILCLQNSPSAFQPCFC